MKSKAHLASHPLHPILVSFPIAFFIGAFLFDLFGIITNRPPFSQVAYYLDIAGIAGALVAAVPGAIDYFMTNVLLLKVSKLITASWNVDLIYDDDVRLFGNDNKSPAVQLKSLVGIGLQAKF